MKGKLIVIEGLDGSGKATQAKRLAAALEQRGKQIRKISFPNYDSDSSAPVRMYLSGAFGTEPGDVNPYAASSFYAVDRYAGMKQDWGRFYEDGGILIADRYTTSNAIHQCCKLPKEQWDSYLHWLFHYEYELLGLPSPDLVIYLRLGIETSQRLMSERYHGDEKKKDTREINMSYLEHAHIAADYCARKYDRKTVDCAEADGLRSIEAIGKDVQDCVWHVIE